MPRGMASLVLRVIWDLCSFGIPECTINVDTLDLFFGRPDDESIESKHVAIRIFCVVNCCVWLKFIPCMKLFQTVHLITGHEGPDVEYR
jgi:hypothetical protein